MLHHPAEGDTTAQTCHPQDVVEGMTAQTPHHQGGDDTTALMPHRPGDQGQQEVQRQGSNEGGRRRRMHHHPGGPPVCSDGHWIQFCIALTAAGLDGGRLCCWPGRSSPAHCP
jgi:hypothetical protein